MLKQNKTIISVFGGNVAFATSIAATLSGIYQILVFLSWLPEFDLLIPEARVIATVAGVLGCIIAVALAVACLWIYFSAASNNLHGLTAAFNATYIGACVMLVFLLAYATLNILIGFAGNTFLITVNIAVASLEIFGLVTAANIIKRAQSALKENRPFKTYANLHIILFVLAGVSFIEIMIDAIAAMIEYDPYSAFDVISALLGVVCSVLLGVIFLQLSKIGPDSQAMDNVKAKKPISVVGKTVRIVILTVVSAAYFVFGYVFSESEITTPSVHVENGLVYQLTEDRDGYIVIGIETNDRDFINIYGSIEKKPIVGIDAEVFKDHAEIKTVIIPDTLEWIGEKAFEGCTALDHISLPATLKVVGAGAFQNCTSLSDIYFREGLQEIGAGAFAYCTSLKSVVIPYDVPCVLYNTFYECTALEKVVLCNGITGLTGETFRNCKNLQYVIVPESVKLLEGEVFYGATCNVFFERAREEYDINDYRLKEFLSTTTAYFPGEWENDGGRPRILVNK